MCLGKGTHMHYESTNARLTIIKMWVCFSLFKSHSLHHVYGLRRLFLFNLSKIIIELEITTSRVGAIVL